jgi:hypothetical protein
MEKKSQLVRKVKSGVLTSILSESRIIGTWAAGVKLRRQTWQITGLLTC